MPGRDGEVPMQSIKDDLIFGFGNPFGSVIVTPKGVSSMRLRASYCS